MSTIRPEFTPVSSGGHTFLSRLRPLSCCTLPLGLAGGWVTNAVTELKAVGARAHQANATMVTRWLIFRVTSIIVTRFEVIHRHRASRASSNNPHLRSCQNGGNKGSLSLEGGAAARLTEWLLIRRLTDQAQPFLDDPSTVTRQLADRRC